MSGPRRVLTTAEGEDAGHGQCSFLFAVRTNQKLLDGLRPNLEKWSGIELQNGQSYGVRVYGEGSTLVNHIDRCETHVISAIFHIDHDLDEPRPLEIEDHDGNWHEVNLKPGEVCYYESAKQYHARLQPMRGRAYASVFLHWFPAQDWNWTMWDGHVMVPPILKLPRRRAFSEKGRGERGPPPSCGTSEELLEEKGAINTRPAARRREPRQEYEGFAAPSPTPRRRTPAFGECGGGAQARAAGTWTRAARAAGHATSTFWTTATRNRWTALHEAARSGHADVLRLLVAKGASASQETGAARASMTHRRDVHHEDHPAMPAPRRVGVVPVRRGRRRTVE